VSAQAAYQLKLTGPGLSLDKEVSEELANRITLLVLSGGKSDQQPSGGTGGAGAGATGGAGVGVAGKSVSEYLIASKATKIPQQMTVIGHYLLETEPGKQNFTMAELSKGFGDAKESPPANKHRDIGSAIKRGWIAPRGKDAYYVTSTGITAIGNGFPKVPRKRRLKKKKTTSKSK